MKLTDKQARKARRLVISVRCFLSRNIVITGVHAANGSLLVRDDKGRPFTADRYTLRDALRPLDAEEVQEWKDLTKAVEDAEDALQEFRDAHAFDAWDAARKAWSEAGGDTGNIR